MVEKSEQSLRFDFPNCAYSRILESTLTRKFDCRFYISFSSVQALAIAQHPKNALYGQGAVQGVQDQGNGRKESFAQFFAGGQRISPHAKQYGVALAILR